MWSFALKQTTENRTTIFNLSVPLLVSRNLCSNINRATLMKNMLIYDVFGRTVGVRRVAGRWQVFRVDLNENKYSPHPALAIPDYLCESEIPGWLDDIFHESATDRHPVVRKIG